MIKCPNCSKDIDQDSAYCEYCGYRMKRVCKHTKVSFWLGVFGVVGWLFPIIGLPLNVFGLVKGIKGHSEDGSSRSIVAIVLNSVFLLLTLLTMIVGGLLLLIDDF